MQVTNPTVVNSAVNDAVTRNDGAEASLNLANADASSAVTSIEGKSSSVGNVRGSAPSSQRLTRGSGSSEGTQHTALSGQIISPTVDATGLARELVSSHNDIHASTSSGESSASGASGVSDTFAALDSEASQSTASWGHTGSHQAEAGYQDPVLGWVGVRADSSGAGIHASLVPGSTEAGQSLSGHLAGLSTYLNEQHTSVDSLTVSTPEGQWSGTGTDQGMGGQTGQGGQSDTQSGLQQTLSNQAAQSSVSSSTTESESTVETPVRGGVHISVMA